MTKNFSIVLALCILTCVVAVFSRPAWSQTENKTSKKSELINAFRSPAAREEQRKMSKTVLQSLWGGGPGENMLTLQMLNDPDIRKGVGVSDEQQKQLGPRLNETMRANPEFVAIEKEMKELRKPDDPFMAKADEATKQRVRILAEKVTLIMMEAMRSTIDQSITSDQKKKIQETQLASMSVYPLVTPDMFKALDLSEDQMKKMETVRQDLKPGFEQMMDQLMDAQFKASDLIFDRMERENITVEDTKQLFEELRKMGEKVKKEDPQFAQLSEEMMGKAQTFTTQMKFKMFDILTDEQLARLEELVNNPSEHAQKFMDKIRAEIGAKRSDSMQPVLDAWKPGEPIPSEYKQQRQGKNFPAKDL